MNFVNKDLLGIGATGCEHMESITIIDNFCMKIKTKVTFKEYLNLLYSLAYQKPIMKLLVSAALILFLWIIFYYLKYFTLPRPIIYQYFTLVLIVLVQPIVIYTTIRRNYYSSNHLRETLDMEILEKEIKIAGETFYMEVTWEKQFKIVEYLNYFLIYQNNLSAIIIRKKDLSADDIINIRKIFKKLVKVPVVLRDS